MQWQTVIMEMMECLAVKDLLLVRRSWIQMKPVWCIFSKHKSTYNLWLKNTDLGQSIAIIGKLKVNIIDHSILMSVMETIISNYTCTMRGVGQRYHILQTRCSANLKTDQWCNLRTHSYSLSPVYSYRSRILVGVRINLKCQLMRQFMDEVFFMYKLLIWLR